MYRPPGTRKQGGKRRERGGKEEGKRRDRGGKEEGRREERKTERGEGLDVERKSVRGGGGGGKEVLPGKPRRVVLVK
jgi:hypothetical protein